MSEESEDQGLKVGDPVRWESAGHGKLLKIEERAGEQVGIVGPGGGWHWSEAGRFFTLDTDDAGDEGVPIRLADLRRAEAPRSFEDRLARIGEWTARIRGLARDSALNMASAATEMFGPGAREHLLAYHGGDRDALAATLRNAKVTIAEVSKNATDAAKADKVVAEYGDFLLQAIDLHYSDALNGQHRQTSLEEVEGGRHKESEKPARKKKEGGAPTAAQAPAATAQAQAEPPRLIPWRSLRAWGPGGPPPPEGNAAGEPIGPTGARIEGEALVDFLTAWRAGKEQLGLLVPYNLLNDEGKVPVLIDFETRLVAADRVALVEQELVKRDGTGTETIERVVLCTPELVDWTAFPGALPPVLSVAQLEEAKRRGLTSEQIASVEAALRADPKVSQVQLSKITGVERTKLNRILNAGETDGGEGEG